MARASSGQAAGGPRAALRDHRLPGRRRAGGRAHIHPYRGEEANHAVNGLLLRADLHTLLDCRLLAIDPDGLRVMVAPSIRATSYAKLHGRTLRARKAGWREPSAEALRLRFEEFERLHGRYR